MVLSTDKQLEEKNEKEMQGIKVKGSKGKNKRFDTLATIDNLSKKQADTVGTLQSKTLSIQNVIEGSCKRSVKEFLKTGEKGDLQKSISSRRSKRIKNEVKVDEEIIDNVYFDPIISLFFYFRQHMLSERWNVRQYCCANLLCMVNTIKLQNYLSNVPDLYDIENLSECLITDLGTRAIVLTLLDHFSDFQENRLLAPVREISVQLMIPCLHIVPIKAICNTVLSSDKLYWMYKYNVLLVLKTMLVEGKKLVEKSQNESNPKTQILATIIDEVKKNKKILDNVCKCLKSEDEVKILACECIEQMVESFMGIDDEDEESKSSKSNDYSTENVYNQLIEQVLNDSDDIECTAISVFNLLIRIAKHPKFEYKKFIDLTTTLPFNFHRMIQVRLSFTLMMREIVKLERQHFDKAGQLKCMSLETLQKLFLMGCQVAIMEK